MSYDENLAERIRSILSDQTELSERNMFGGLAFMLRGHMCCGVNGVELMARVGPDAYEAALQEPHVREMDFTGKPLKGFVYVSADGTASEANLGKWVERAAEFVLSLPPK